MIPQRRRIRRVPLAELPALDTVRSGQRAAEHASAPRAAGRTRELDGVVQIIAHDVRSPLQGITFCCDLLSRRCAAGDEQSQELLAAIRGMVGQIEGLVSDVLDPSFTGAETADAGTTAVSTALHDAVARHLRLAAVSQVTLDIGPATNGERGEHGQLCIEAPRLQRVLANLLTNAIRFTPPGGRVRVSSSELDSGTAIFVSDTGVGIPEHRLDGLFDAAPSDGRRSAGEHGLHIVKRIVEDAGGRVSVASRVGHGSTFTVILPRSDADPGRREAPAATAAGRQRT